ncbi:MAG: hypothetical protein KI793_30605 [Rivularia sp. (in: Bacteria)]|nr:hypothetical protein [Rivularia sp. MS3]
MDKIAEGIQKLSDNSLFNGALALIGIILALIGIYLTIRSIKKKIPAYYFESRSLNFSGEYSRVKDLEFIFKYKNEPVDKLTFTRILFINKGRDIIDNSDIIPDRPFRISLKSNFKVLDAQILYSRNQSMNNLKIEWSDNDIFILFDYLAQLEGLVIQIVHTGTEKDICLKGFLKGSIIPIRYKDMALQYLVC